MILPLLVRAASRANVALPSTRLRAFAILILKKVGASSTAGTMRFVQPAPPPRCMHRRIEIDWALFSMTPKAVPAAPLGLLARQCHADADGEAAAAIVAPKPIARRYRTDFIGL